MRTKTTIMIALLCLTALAALPTPVTADPSVCSVDCLIACPDAACPTVRCLPLLVGLEAHALGNHVGAQVTVSQNCQVSETGVPLPPYYCPCFPLIGINPSQATEVCVTVGLGTAPATTQCIGIDQSTGCLSANGVSIACPLPPACSYPPTPTGGVIGEAIAYAEQLGTIACQAAAATAGVAGQAVATTAAFVTSQVPCSGGCQFMAPPWVMAYVNSLVGTAAGQGAGQAYLACALMLGPESCSAIAPAGTTGTCPVPITRTGSGVVGDVERYAGASCDLAQGAVASALVATKVFASNGGQAAGALVASAGAIVDAKVAQATVYATTMAGYGTTAAGIAVTAATSSCTATTGLLTGGACPV